MRLFMTVSAFIFPCCLFIASGQQPRATVPASKNGFVVIAHRGSHLVKPENTIAAIEDAIKLGADYVEIDLRSTKDGHLVLCHNETVDATTDSTGSVHDLTWDALSKLFVKSTDGKAYHIPEFKEVLKVCRNRINIYLDFKDADVVETYRQILDAGMENHVVVYLNKADQYNGWRKTAAAMPLMSSLPASVRTSEDLLGFLGMMSLQVLDNVTDSLLLVAARHAGIQVWLDVQGAGENEARWKAAMHKGIQGVQTDHPEALIQYLDLNKLRNGATPLRASVMSTLKLQLGYQQSAFSHQEER
jgi:glycerophosphoryl diester phosphodiesterase